MTTLSSARLLLRPVIGDDLTDTYVGWLNDPAVNACLETRFEPQTLESVRAYWQAHGTDPTSPWWAICRRDQQDRHIGNIKLGPIHPIHLRADISLFIGDRGSWGLGLATEAIALVRDWALLQLGLHKLCAGIYAENNASSHAFEKCGFRLEGRFVDEVVNAHGTRSDVLRLGLVNSLGFRKASLAEKARGE
ncbi:MAG: GNAT family N-acetyltransferase [Cyanobacteria bacterium K_DeepCast_35m_m2_023]|nr:GNAT family N-acetyltransferase [Cyanobacteria bacterium K_DeepCast_35m_m2_023]